MAIQFEFLGWELSSVRRIRYDVVTSLFGLPPEHGELVVEFDNRDEVVIRYKNVGDGHKDYDRFASAILCVNEK